MEKITDESRELLPIIKGKSRTIKSKYKATTCIVCGYYYKRKWLVKFLNAIGFLYIVQCPECRVIDQLTGNQIIHNSCAISYSWKNVQCSFCGKESRVGSDFVHKSFGPFVQTKLKFKLEEPMLVVKPNL
jgi:phage FluMu protein Com